MRNVCTKNEIADILRICCTQNKSRYYDSQVLSFIIPRLFSPWFSSRACALLVKYNITQKLFLFTSGNSHFVAVNSFSHPTGHWARIELISSARSDRADSLFLSPSLPPSSLSPSLSSSLFGRLSLAWLSAGWARSEEKNSSVTMAVKSITDWQVMRV